MKRIETVRVGCNGGSLCWLSPRPGGAWVHAAATRCIARAAKGSQGTGSWYDRLTFTLAASTSRLPTTAINRPGPWPARSMTRSIERRCPPPGSAERRCTLTSTVTLAVSSTPRNPRRAGTNHAGGEHGGRASRDFCLTADAQSLYPRLRQMTRPEGAGGGGGEGSVCVLATFTLACYRVEEASLSLCVPPTRTDHDNRYAVKFTAVDQMMHVHCTAVCRGGPGPPPNARDHHHTTAKERARSMNRIVDSFA